MTLIDVTKLSNFQKDMFVKLRNGKDGLIYKISSHHDDPDGIVVITYEGQEDHVVFASIKEDIRAETQHTENKDSFLSDIMKTKVIPLTIQSFLNSEGGRLYIGVQDGWVDGQQIVGLDSEKQLLEEEFKENFEKDKKNSGKNPPEYSFADFRDDYEMQIREKVGKYLTSDMHLQPLLFFDFPKVNGTTILQITIDPSKKPVFYKNLNTKNKQITYAIPGLGDRTLDTFAYRSGNKKDYCYTSEDFFKYCMNHRFFILK